MPRATLNAYSLFYLKEDDERFKLKAGDILLGCPYQYDHDKTSVAFRISDGYRPECNQYNSSVRSLTADELERAVWGGVLEPAK